MQQQQQPAATAARAGRGPPPAAAGALPALSGVYVFDCGCHLAASDGQHHLQQLAATLPGSLAAAASHFACPVPGCGQPVTRRDLAALLGEAVCSRIDAHLWSLAASAAQAAEPSSSAAPAAAVATTDEMAVIDLVDSQPSAAAQAAGDGQAVEQQCIEVAGLLQQLHAVLVEGKLPGQHAAPVAGDSKRQQQPGSATGAQGSKARAPKQQQQAKPGGSKWGGPTFGSALARGGGGGAKKGIGYGGDELNDPQDAQQRLAEAAERQRQLDRAAAELLQQLLARLQACAGEKDEAGAVHVRRVVTHFLVILRP